MIEITGNLWDQTQADAICITTNGFVKANGEAVMGRGCAKEAADRIEGLALHFGKLLKEQGNQVQIIAEGENQVLVAFPVKPTKVISDGTNFVSHLHYQVGKVVPGWAAKADLRIIIKSAWELKSLATFYGWEDVIIPRPGCGHGELAWEDVKAIISPILDDRFKVITY